MYAPVAELADAHGLGPCTEGCRSSTLLWGTKLSYTRKNRAVTMAKIYPVIHHLDDETTLQEVGIAKEIGADGVFLISHTGNDREILVVVDLLHGVMPDFFVGVNLLNTGPLEAFDRAYEANASALWLDSAGVSSSGLTEIGEKLQARYEATDSWMPIFASVAFKYQKEELNPPLAAQFARDAGFIPTTSGPATGNAPDLAKIQAMSEVVQGTLAIASGMTPQNIHRFVPYLDYVLVSTGISYDFHHIDPNKLKELIINAQPVAMQGALTEWNSQST